MKPILTIITLTISLNCYAEYNKPYEYYRPSIIPSDYANKPIRREFTHKDTTTKVQPYSKPYEYYRPSIIPSDYNRKTK